MSERNQTLQRLPAASLRSSIVSRARQKVIQTGLMVARAAALRININTDGRLLRTKTRRRKSSKSCAPHLLDTSCAPHFHLPVTQCPHFHLPDSPCGVQGSSINCSNAQMLPKIAQ